MKLTEKLNKVLEAKVPEDEKGKISYVKKRGNIITFKDDVIDFDGKKRKQIVVDKLHKDNQGLYLESKKLKLLGDKSSKSKVFKSEKELIDAVDWNWMSKNTTR
jgi:hypothetical protein